MTLFFKPGAEAKFLFLLIFSTFLAGLPSCSVSGDSALLEKLDNVLEQKDTYQGYFRDRMSVLKDVLSEQTDLEQIYSINRRIADSYIAHSFDSTLAYLQDNREIAHRLGDPSKIIDTDFMLVKLYVMSGYNVEASDILGQYDISNVPPSMLGSFYDVSHVYWGETMAYASTGVPDDGKWEKRNAFRDLLLSVTPEGTFEWYDLKREEAEAAGDMESTRAYALRMTELSGENTHDYAKACYFYAETFQEPGSPEYEEWLIRSAIADVMCATNDYASLNSLSRHLFVKGDIDRAFRYVADHCMCDALSYNGKLRPWQISRFFPEIEKAYQLKHARATRVMTAMIVFISALVLVLLILLLVIFMRQQILDSMRHKLQESYIYIEDRNHELVAINSRLVSLNAKMQEADKVKQEYIALFLSMVSENISKVRQYKNHVLKAIRQGKTKALVEEIELLPPIDEDISEFYKMFDETFVNLYPDFVDKFNSLLADGAAIVPKGDDILTPELRIFALIKLGISDSSKIASLLHYSANTIYNYRAKTKNKARGSREDFEDAVRNIE
ncbi:MAG: hypothetical protein K2O58_00150 [Bacteroidales bacterium]|nr:hypothetical protein [Bacteroidales bacterium]MDE6872700.1 hypothetical protein [Bacteroidales bacterium]MDE7126297.1 hypothetical protein [Bacteroidales bacterium]